MPAFLFFFRKAVIPPPILAIHACKILSFSITGQELSYRTKAFFLLDAGERGGLAAPEKTKMIICLFSLANSQIPGFRENCIRD